MYDIALPERKSFANQLGSAESQGLAILLKRNFHPSETDVNRWTDLHYAALLNDDMLANDLIARGANI